uniref:Wsv137-like protein n=1 Tax=Penaeus semisulcatus majanivirus TaxID=2984274 RepID=A0A9C7EYE5_9VIRU|nr:MAG: wsv137-like protein [Penaeus semisulcatus majanivirus]
MSTVNENCRKSNKNLPSSSSSLSSSSSSLGFCVENLAHLKIGLVDYFNFITSSAGLDTLRDIIMMGTHNRSNKIVLWNFIKSLPLIKIGITILNDDDGTIDAIETKCIRRNDGNNSRRSSSSSNSDSNISSNVGIDDKRTNINSSDNSCNFGSDLSSSSLASPSSFRIPQRVHQAMVIVFRLISENREWQPSTTKRDTINRSFFNIDLSEHIDFQNVDIVCSAIIDDAKKKEREDKETRPTTIWFALENIYRVETHDDSSPDAPETVAVAAAAAEVVVARTTSSLGKRSTISHYEYDRDDITAIDNFFSLSSSHKVNCCNPRHRDEHPSMHLYRRSSVWLSRVGKCKPTRGELRDLEMKENLASESNISSFRGSNIILFIISAHCYACQHHVNFLPKSDLKRVLSAYYTVE